MRSLGAGWKMLHVQRMREHRRGKALTQHFGIMLESVAQPLVGLEVVLAAELEAVPLESV